MEYTAEMIAELASGRPLMLAYQKEIEMADERLAYYAENPDEEKHKEFTAMKYNAEEKLKELVRKQMEEANLSTIDEYCDMLLGWIKKLKAFIVLAPKAIKDLVEPFILKAEQLIELIKKIF